MENDVNIYSFKEKSWEPVVRNDHGNLTYLVPVACGHSDKTFRFSISQKEFDVLKCDEQRRYFLYATLHSLYQSRSADSDIHVDPHIRKILLGTYPDVESLLTRRDAESNGAVSNLVRIYMGRDQKMMLAGSWFSK